MSTLEVGKIVPATGTAITLGETGDTLTVPSGATLAIASGATLNASGATQTGFSSGISDASTWRLTTTFANSADPINANLEEVDAPVGYGKLGGTMTQSSGVFTFPSTGTWLITAILYAYQTANGASGFTTWEIETCTDGSTMAESARARVSDYYAQYLNATAQYIFNVTSTSTHKCQFKVTCGLSSTNITGSTNANYTYFTFMKLGDST